MKLPTLKELDQIRKNGHRPQVVGCFLHNKKILFLYKKEHDLWQFPQGGIDNNETIEEAVLREMKEELGSDFLKDVEVGDLIMKDGLEFSSDKWGSRNLKTDDGEEVLMKGKKYFVIKVKAGLTELDINQTEFDDYRWLDYEEALKLTETIYQKGKKRITEEILDSLRELMLL